MNSYLNVLDLAFEKLLECDEYTEDVYLAIEVYSRSAKMKHEKLILETITALVTNKLLLEEERPNLLELDAMKYSLSHKSDLVGFLWTVYDAILMFADPGTFTVVIFIVLGTSINIDIFIETMEKSLNVKDEAISEFCLIPLRTIAKLSKSYLLMRSRQILSVIANYDLPERLLYGILLALNESFGSASLIYKKFPNLITTLTRALETNKECSEFLIRLIISVLKTSAIFIKPSTILNLQKSVCHKALEWSPTSNDIKLLNSLLELNIESIPSPVQLAQTIYWRNFNTTDDLFIEEINRGRKLLGTIVRPRSHQYIALMELGTALLEPQSDPVPLPVTYPVMASTISNEQELPKIEKSNLSADNDKENEMESEIMVITNQPSPSTNSIVEDISSDDDIQILEPNTKQQSNVGLNIEQENSKISKKSISDMEFNNEKRIVKELNETTSKSELTIEEMLEDFVPV